MSRERAGPGHADGGGSAWSPAALREQLGRTWRAYVLCLGAALGGALAVYGISRLTELSLIELTRDPASSFEFFPFAGLLSTLGTLLWAATAGVCLVGARSGVDIDGSRFRLQAGLLTLLLCLDDVFLLHEEIVPAMIPVRGAEYGMYALYVLLTAGLVLRHARLILKTDFLLLGMAISFLAISLMMDKLLPYRAADGTVNQATVYLEDCFKFAGIVVWFCYFSRSTGSLRSGGT